MLIRKFFMLLTAVFMFYIAPSGFGGDIISCDSFENCPDGSVPLTNAVLELDARVNALEAEVRTCTPDSVPVGDACIDKYEASVWQTTDANTISRIRRGLISNANELSGLATQYGAKTDDYDAVCPNNAAGCTGAFAVSIPGIIPADHITWFQAAATCRNAGKRLATNQEWQLAALGTPDTGTDNGSTTCNLTGSASTNTGSRSSCVSDSGAYDMVGNLWEWVADWWPAVINSYSSGTSYCNESWGSFSDDYNCGALNVTTDGPSAMLRGGDAWVSGGQYRAGPFAIAMTRMPQTENVNVGFRCARSRSGVTVTTVDQGFCGGALSLSGTSSADILQISNSSAINLNGPFTIEARVYLREFVQNNTAIGTILRKYSGSNFGREYTLNIFDQKYPRLWISEDGTLENSRTALSTTPISLNQWTHIAGVFDGSAYRVFMDGVLVSPVIEGPPPHSSGTYPIEIGGGKCCPSFNSTMNGMIDEVRVSDVARYSTNFTPPIKEFMPDANTLILMHFDSGIVNDGLVGGDGILYGSAGIVNCSDTIQ
jgi:hypothetical protein